MSGSNEPASIGRYSWKIKNSSFENLLRVAFFSYRGICCKFIMFQTEFFNAIGQSEFVVRRS